MNRTPILFPVKVEKILDPQATTRPPYSIPLLRGS